MTQRRNMEVQFIGGNWIALRHEPDISTTVLRSVALEGNMKFSPGAGRSGHPGRVRQRAAVTFGPATTIMFNPEGALIDGGGNPLNGTVFLTIAQTAAIARARSPFWAPPAAFAATSGCPPTAAGQRM